jgi:hypothetical protein
LLSISWKFWKVAAPRTAYWGCNLFILPILILPVLTGRWKQPPQADGQRPNTAMPPVLTGGSLLGNGIF